MSWDTREADVPSMTVNGTNLQGNDAMVSVVTLVDGGMWLRPLRADMLRVPELSPQVQCTYERVGREGGRGEGGRERASK